MLEYISLKFGLTLTEIKTFFFIFVVFILGLVVKEVKYNSLNIKSKKFSYEIYDSLFNSADNQVYRSFDSLKKSEKRVDSEVELYDFSNDKKDSKKNIKAILEPFSININTADIKTLVKLPGIGKVTAARIIEFRENKGGIKDINELLQVKRVGKKTLNKIKKYLIIEN